MSNATTDRPSASPEATAAIPPAIIDMHTHIWGDASTPGSSSNDEQTLLRMADRYALEALVVMPLFGGVCPTSDDVEAANRAVADLARRDPRVRPMAYVYPPLGTRHALEQIDRWIADGGFVGLKIWVSIADDPLVFPLIERMIELDKPTLIHAMHKSVGQLPLESDPKHIAALATRYPQAKLIMPHMGGNFLYSCAVIAPHANVWTDPSGTYCESGMLEHALRVLGEDRILFGSDAPGADFVNNLAKVLAADLPATALRKILAGNAKRLWGWG